MDSYLSGNFSLVTANLSLFFSTELVKHHQNTCDQSFCFDKIKENLFKQVEVAQSYICVYIVLRKDVINVGLFEIFIAFLSYLTV